MNVQVLKLGNGNVMTKWVDGDVTWALTSSVSTPGTFNASIRNGNSGFTVFTETFGTFESCMLWLKNNEYKPLGV